MMNTNNGHVTMSSIPRDAIRTCFVPLYLAFPPNSFIRAKLREMDENEVDLGREVFGFLEALC